MTEIVVSTVVDMTAEGEWGSMDEEEEYDHFDETAFPPPKDSGKLRCVWN